MAPRPSELWTSWLGKAQATGTWLTRTLPGLMRDEGFQAPRQRQVLEQALSGLEAPAGSWGAHVFTEVHFLNLLWLPLQEHIHQVAAGSSPMWTAALDKHHQALTAEMQGIVPSPDEVLDFSDWVQYICKAIKRHLDVDIPHERATRILALVAPHSLETTRAMAMHVLRSSVCQRMVGAGMALQISRGVLAQVAELPVASLSDQEYRRCLQQDILTLLAQQDKPEAAAATPAAKRRRDKESESQSLRDKTLEVWYCLTTEWPSAATRRQLQALWPSQANSAVDPASPASRMQMQGSRTPCTVATPSRGTS